MTKTIYWIAFKKYVSILNMQNPSLWSEEMTSWKAWNSAEGSFQAEKLNFRNIHSCAGSLSLTQLSQCPSTLSISPPKGSPCKTLPLVTEIEPKVERIAQKLNQKFNHELNELHTLMNVCSFYSALISMIYI